MMPPAYANAEYLSKLPDIELTQLIVFAKYMMFLTMPVSGKAN